MNLPLPRSRFGKKFEDNYDRIFGKGSMFLDCHFCDGSGFYCNEAGDRAKCKACLGAGKLHDDADAGNHLDDEGGCA